MRLQRLQESDMTELKQAIDVQEQQCKIVVECQNESQTSAILLVITPKNKYGPKYIQIKKGNWYLHRMSEKVTHIQQLSIQQIYLNGNRHPTILQQISHIRMYGCKILDLSGNMIESVEPLSKIGFTHLSTIILNQNLIVNMGCLSKMNIESLQIIEIKNNRIVSQVFQLSNCPNINKVIIEMSPVDSLQFHRMNWLSKTNIRNIKKIQNFEIDIENSNRISLSLKLQSVLKNRFPSLQIVQYNTKYCS